MSDVKKNKKGRSDDDVRLVEKMVMHRNLFFKEQCDCGVLSSKLQRSVTQQTVL